MRLILMTVILSLSVLRFTLAHAEAPMIDQLKPYSVSLSVSHLDEMASWYESKLNFVEVKAKDYPEYSTSLKFLEHNHYRVELIKDGNAKTGSPRLVPPKHTSVWGVSQFAFETSNLTKLKSELQERKVPIIWEFENKDLGAKFIFIKDPEGNLIQFLQRL